MMKYMIRRKRLPQARLDQVYTLTVFLGVVSDGSSEREAKVQYPVMSHREGICKYREILRMQRVLDEQATSCLAQQNNKPSFQPQTSPAMPVAV